MTLPRRLLIVHPAPTATEAVRLALTGSGFEVRSAADAAEARVAQRDFVPDLLLLDAAFCEPMAAELAAPALRFADVALDLAARTVTRGGEAVELTPTEFRLLRFLMSHPERVLTRSQLLEHVWSYDFGGDARVLETYVSYLRRKLERHGPRLIHTVRGVGYVLRAPDDSRNPSPPHTAIRRSSHKVTAP